MYCSLALGKGTPAFVKSLPKILGHGAGYGQSVELFLSACFVVFQRIESWRVWLRCETSCIHGVARSENSAWLKSKARLHILHCRLQQCLRTPDGVSWSRIGLVKPRTAGVESQWMFNSSCCNVGYEWIRISWVWALVPKGKNQEPWAGAVPRDSSGMLSLVLRTLSLLIWL